MTLPFHSAPEGLVRVCGHRGFSLRYPENTIDSFSAARDAGADECELDLFLTRDDEIVVIHDRTLDRTTNGHGFVADYDVETIQALDAGRWLSPRFVGVRVPTFADVLAWAGEKDMRLVIEMKERERPEVMSKILLDMLRDAGAFEDVSVISFDHVVLAAFKASEPRIMTEAITHPRHIDPVGLLRGGNFDGISIEFEHFHAADAKKIRDAGFAVRLSLPRPEKLAQFWENGRDPVPAIKQWMEDGIIDAITVDDVMFGTRLTGKGPHSSVQLR